MSHNRPSTNWRTRRVGGITESRSKGMYTRRLLLQVLESEGLRTRSSTVPGQKRMDVLAQGKEGIYPSFALLCYPGPQ